MDGYKPSIRLVGYENGELAPFGDWPFESFGSLPNIGDVILDPIDVHLLGPMVVTKRFFTPVLGGADIWYLLVEHQSQNSEGMSIHRLHLELQAIHAEIMAEHEAAEKVIRDKKAKLFLKRNLAKKKDRRK